jgi:hypothetical protein
MKINYKRRLSFAISQIYYFRRGLIIGAIAGLLFAWWIIGKDYNTLSSIVQSSKGYLYNIMTRSSPATIELTKIYVFFAGMGAVVGWAFEYFLLRIIKIYGGR